METLLQFPRQLVKYKEEPSGKPNENVILMIFEQP